ncbi:fumarate hydratase subunit beta [Anaerobacterium chartisolvens]|uniref:Fumarate hydratase subunit beta n=1 Tax=Anaerobacterium chartisolvens TaxID=1297424 RepID=A0A369B7P1_9FIRM|nr:Fe-S-containing hydro-lyase [Anaerobacterium chartisolvens]RCX16618.1 fumarate hydratase subunit beta [Anaerobacterium chartisolvens]
MVYTIEAPLTAERVRLLKAGDSVEINGTIYTARDAAHRRMAAMIQEGKALPFDVKDQIIYYVGPCPAREGEVIGSAGPTTSSRMDAYAPALIEMGLTGMIGKGLRSSAVIEAMIKHGSVYFGATGGAGALISRAITAEEVIAFPELGPEAVRKLTVKGFPATVIIDSYGNNLYEQGKERYRVI